MEAETTNKCNSRILLIENSIYMVKVIWKTMWKFHVTKWNIIFSTKAQCIIITEFFFNTVLLTKTVLLINV